MKAFLILMIVGISLMVKAKYEDYEAFTDTFEEL